MIGTYRTIHRAQPSGGQESPPGPTDTHTHTHPPREAARKHGLERHPGKGIQEALFAKQARPMLVADHHPKGTEVKMRLQAY